MAHRKFTDEQILAALEANGDSRKLAAKSLGLHESTFYTHLKHLGVKRKKREPASPLFEPTPEQIEAGCAEIQKTWNKTKERLHRGAPEREFVEVTKVSIPTALAGGYRLD